jgi:hypothetical protein
MPRTTSPAVAAYLASVPKEQRPLLDAVRAAVLAGLDKDYDEIIQYGGIGYVVPHSIHPAGYHCTPKEPLPFANLAARKGGVSLGLMSLYGDEKETARFEAAWAKTGRKLDMGKACVRFKKLEDLAPELITDVIRRMPARAYSKHVTATLEARAPTKKTVAKKTAAKEATTKKSTTTKATATKATNKSATTKQTAAKTSSSRTTSTRSTRAALG